MGRFDDDEDDFSENYSKNKKYDDYFSENNFRIKSKKQERKFSKRKVKTKNYS